MRDSGGGAAAWDRIRVDLHLLQAAFLVSLAKFKMGFIVFFIAVYKKKRLLPIELRVICRIFCNLIYT